MSDSISYRLLGIAQELAVNGIDQTDLANMYREMDKDGMTELFKRRSVASWILDKTRTDDWKDRTK